MVSIVVVRDGKASEAAFTALAGYYSAEELIETTLLVGYYMMASRFLQTGGSARFGASSTAHGLQMAHKSSTQ